MLKRDKNNKNKFDKIQSNNPRRQAKTMKQENIQSSTVTIPAAQAAPSGTRPGFGDLFGPL